MVVVHATPFESVLQMYEVSSKYLSQFSSYRGDTLLLTALWPYYLASSQLFSGKFSTGKDSQVHFDTIL